MVNKSKVLKVTISGSYKAGNKDIESYENVQGIMPALDDDKVNQMAIKRYARIWIGQAKKLDAAGNPTDEAKYKRVEKIRQVFIDSIEDVENSVLSYVGKNIMEMNFEDLQDLAAAKDLSGVPLYKTGSLATARRIAFSEYSIKVLGLDPKEFDHRSMNFNPAKHPPVIADGIIRRSGDHVANIEETIDREKLALEGKAKPSSASTAPAQSKLTLQQLKAIADGKNISYHQNIGYEMLYSRVYPRAA